LKKGFLRLYARGTAPRLLVNRRFGDGEQGESFPVVLKKVLQFDAVVNGSLFAIA
jgi:hypothetical protein